MRLSEANGGPLTCPAVHPLLYLTLFGQLSSAALKILPCFDGVDGLDGALAHSPPFHALLLRLLALRLVVLTGRAKKGLPKRESCQHAGLPLEGAPLSRRWLRARYCVIFRKKIARHNPNTQFGKVLLPQSSSIVLITNRKSWQYTNEPTELRTERKVYWVGRSVVFFVPPCIRLLCRGPWQKQSSKWKRAATIRRRPLAPSPMSQLPEISTKDYSCGRLKLSKAESVPVC